MPDAVPPAVARSFEQLLPTAVVILLIGGITYFAGFDWHGFVGMLVKPLVSASDSLGSVLLIVFLTCFFWVFGIHGASIVGSLARPVWLILLEQNATALAAGGCNAKYCTRTFLSMVYLDWWCRMHNWSGNSYGI